MAEKLALSILLFLLPTQFAYHFWPSWSFVFGIRVDYLAPTIYLTDILVLFLVFCSKDVVKKNLKIFGFVFILAFVNCVFSTLPAVSLVKWIRVIEMVFFGVYIANQKVLKKENLLKIVFVSTALVSLIGLAQVLRGSTLGGAFYFLGERAFNVATPGIALSTFFGKEILRAYSTFSHPNSLAGYIVVVGILTIFVPKRSRVFWVGLLVMTLCLFATASLSALIGLVVVGIAYLIFRKRTISKNMVTLILAAVIIVSLLLPILSLKNSNNFSQTVSERLDLALLSGQMISEKFFAGHGLNTFVAVSPVANHDFITSWLLQPVHNIFLLVFSEVGIVGLLAFCFLLYKITQQAIKKNKIALVLAILFVVTTGSLDHYWLTLQQNMLLFSTLCGLSFEVS